MSHTYTNPWHKPSKPQYGPAEYRCEFDPAEYRGYLIFHRINSTGSIKSGSHVFDIVRDGVCLSQMAGPNGARSKIDQIIEGVQS